MSSSIASKVPSLVYGTAWKKDRTRELVMTAILAGFRGIDTAAQPKHYQEDLVGEGIRAALEHGGLSRKDIYVQTKYTSIHGQDPSRTPYDPQTSITDQVHASVASSLRNLHTKDNAGGDDYLDCLVLHSPFPSPQQTREAWKAMEAHVPHPVRSLGISNIYHLPALQDLYDFASIKPTVVQNRFYPETGYDAGIRAFCAEKQITYQSFWTLTANPDLLRSRPAGILAEKANVSLPVALYGLVLALGKMSVLDGTTNPEHMTDDLDGIENIEAWKEQCPVEFEDLLVTFRALLE